MCIRLFVDLLPSIHYKGHMEHNELLAIVRHSVNELEYAIYRNTARSKTHEDRDKCMELLRKLDQFTREICIHADDNFPTT